MKILVSGGTGFIGSHTCVSLLQRDYDLIIVDNLINSDISVVDKIRKITNKNFEFSYLYFLFTQLSHMKNLLKILKFEYILKI